MKPNPLWVLQFIALLAFIAWLILLAPMAIAGFLFVGRKSPVPTEQVDASKTLCKSLWQKGLLPREDYEFEYTEVSQNYSGNVFRGYQFLVGPVIFALDNSHCLDDIVLFLVKRWIALQRAFKLSSQPIFPFDYYLSKFAIGYASGMGRFLFRFHKDIYQEI